VQAGQQLLDALHRQDPNIAIPSYDKSAFSGAGDRRPISEWDIVNKDGQQPVDVVIMEGWCVGFRALPNDELQKRWKEACARAANVDYTGQLGRVELENVAFINDRLLAYNALTDRLEAFIYM
jgi:pantothenate kinase-related protein Tda10